MSNLMQGKALRDLKLGTKVVSGTVTHAIADTDAFTVAGGRVCINLIYGLLTGVGAGANNCTAGNNPTTGTTSVFAVQADINAGAIGDIVSFEYTAGQLTTHIGAATQAGAYRLVATTGTVFVRCSAAEGTSIWTLFYVPIDDGAYVVAI
jgi:hypothetical protein